MKHLLLSLCLVFGTPFSSARAAESNLTPMEKLEIGGKAALQNLTAGDYMTAYLGYGVAYSVAVEAGIRPSERFVALKKLVAKRHLEAAGAQVRRQYYNILPNPEYEAQTILKVANEEGVQLSSSLLQLLKKIARGRRETFLLYPVEPRPEPSIEI